jgi:MFS family permease
VSIALFVVSGGFGTIALLQATASLTLAVPDETRAQTMGLSNTGLTTMLGISPLLGGLLADHVSPQSTVGIFGLVGIVMTLPLAFVWQRSLNGNPGRWVDEGAARADHA